LTAGGSPVASGLRRALGPIALVGLLAAYGLWQSQHLGGLYWDTDEGINVMKARLVQLGYRLYSEVWSDQPPGYTLAVAWAFDAFGPRIEVARAVTLAHALAAIGAAVWLAREARAGWTGALAGGLLLAFAPNFFWASRAAMIGLPALAFGCTAIALALAYARTGRRVLLPAAGLALAVGLTEKLIGLYLVAPIALAIVLRHAAASRSSAHTRTHPRPRSGTGAHAGAAALDLAAFALPGVVLAAIAGLTFDVGDALEQAVGTVVAARAVPEYALDRAWTAAKLGDWLLGDQLFIALPALAGGACLVAELVGFLSTAGTRRGALAVPRQEQAGPTSAPDGSHDRSVGAPGRRAPSFQGAIAAAVLLTWLGLTLVALFNQTPLWPKHHFLALLVVIAPLAGVGIDRTLGALLRTAASRSLSGADAARLAVGGATIIAMLFALPTALAADALRLQAMPYKESGKLPSHSDAWRRLPEAVSMVREHAPAEAFLITDHGVLALSAGLVVPPELAVVSGKRTAGGHLTDQDVIAVAEANPTSAVLLWQGDRLSRMPEFAAWVRSRYRLGGSLDDDYELWLPPR